jgi:hypothetical protein
MMKAPIFCLLWLLFAANSCFSQSFQKGNFVVARYGTGEKPLTNSAIEVFLDEYNPSGKLVRTLAMPIAKVGTNHAFTGLNSNFYEGILSLAGNGQSISLAGYDAAPNTTLIGVGPEVVNRTIAFIDSKGSINTATTILKGVGSIRSVASQDGSGFWITGGVPGIYYATPDGNITQVLNAGCRNVSVFGGQLYASATAGVRIGTLGSGLSVSAARLKNLPGVADTEGFPNQFVLVDVDQNGAPDLLYIADSGTTPATGKITKYSFNGQKWTFKGEVSSVGITEGMKAITAVVVDKTIRVYGLTSGKLSAVVQLIDLPETELSAATKLTTIVSAPKNTSFKGIAMAPSL